MVKGTHLHPGGSAHRNNYFGNQCVDFSENAQDTVILLLGTYPEDAQLYHKNMSSSMFIAELFVIARTWKQPKSPSIEEWIRRMWYICTMEYYKVGKIMTS